MSSTTIETTGTTADDATVAPAPKPVSALAQRIAVKHAAAGVELLPEYLPLVEILNEKPAGEKVTYSDVANALAAATDPEVVALNETYVSLKVESDAVNARLAEVRKSAQAILFPGTAPTHSDSELAEIRAEAAEMRKYIAASFKSARETDPNIILPEVPTLTGKIPSKSINAEGTARARFFSIVLKGEAKDGSDISLTKPTLSNLRVEIASATGVKPSAIDNADLLAAFLDKADVAMWQEATPGQEYEFTYTVDSESGREVTIVAATRGKDEDSE